MQPHFLKSDYNILGVYVPT